MKRPNHRHAAVPAAIATALACWSQGAGASGFALMEQNASGLGNAYAGAAAVAEDAGTIYYNPAGMTRIKGRQFVGALSLIAPSMRFTDSGGSRVPGVGLPGLPALQNQGGGDGGDAGGLAAIPAAYLSWEADPGKLWLGVSLNAPFGLSTEWDSGWIGRFHAIESSVESLTINPSVAWKVNETVSLGAGVSFQQMKATLTNAVPYSALAASTGGLAALTAVGGPGVEGTARVKGDSWAAGFNVGATFQVSPATRLGVSYRSKIDHELEGGITFSGRPAALAGSLPDGPVKAKISLPDSLSIALAHDVNARWQLLADYTWTGWSSIPALTIERANGQMVSSSNLAFRNSWRVGVGANYRMDDKWTLRFGVAYDRTPVQEAERTPRLPDKSRVWTGAGAQWRMSPKTAFDFGLVYLWIPDASSNLTTQSGGTLVGTYEANTWVLGAQIRHDF